MRFLITGLEKASKAYNEATSRKCKIIRESANKEWSEQWPRRHLCFGKKFQRIWSSWSALNLRLCTEACFLQPLPKTAYLLAVWDQRCAFYRRLNLLAEIESQEGFIQASSLRNLTFNSSRALQDVHPLRKRSLKMLEKSK